jgi:hypothetical protein
MLLDDFFYIPKNFLTTSIKGRLFKEVTISRLGAFFFEVSGFFTNNNDKDSDPFLLRLFSYLIQSSYFISLAPLHGKHYIRTCVLNQDKNPSLGMSIFDLRSVE